MSLLSRLTSVFRPERLNREIDEEQEFHIASLTEEFIDGGMKPEEAARQARVQFGSRTRVKAESRDARLFDWLEATARDFYYGFRTLRKSPGFAAVAILTLALGIGANTAIFSVVNGVLLNPLPYPDADRIVTLFRQVPISKWAPVSYPNFLDWQRMNRTFSAMGAYSVANFNVSGDGGEPEHLQGEMISAEFFEILGIQPVVGRKFTPNDDHWGAAPTAMISEGLWKRKFGSTQNIIGQRLIVDGVGRTIIGVVPSHFHFQEGTSLNEIYTPIGEWNEPEFHNSRSTGWAMFAIGRLKPGVTIEQARGDMDRVSRQLAAAYPDTNSNANANLIQLKDLLIGNMRPVLFILLGAVGFVLLIACVNVANLLLARSTARQREFSIRLALGAGQMRMVRQLLTESILLALIGGGLGLIFARFGTAAAIAAMPQTLPRAEEIGLDFHVLLFTFLISLTAGVVFGLAPALKTRHADIAEDLKENGRSVAQTRSRAQGIFVIMEMAMALVLLVGAGLMIRTLFVLWGASPGFDPSHVLTFWVSPPGALQKEPPAAIGAFFRQLHDTIASTPDIESTTLSWGSNPMEDDYEWSFSVAGRPKPAHKTDLPDALTYVIEPDYLRTLQIPLKRGRLLTSSDEGENAPAVVVIDENFARKYFPGEDPIGRYLDLTDDPDHSGVRNPQIVGIVGHVNQWGLDRDATSSIKAQMYVPMPDRMMNNLARRVAVYVRGKRETPDFKTLRQRLLTMNGELTVFDGQPMEQLILRSIATQRFTMMLLAVFAGIALVLASIGIYGVLSYLVGQRTQEIGVRMALGAARWDVLHMILADGARMAAAGIGIGVVAALGLTHLMSSMLFGVKPTDVPTFVLVSLTLAVIALLACYVPARRAMKIDPMTALRNE